ncbi:MAG: PfkB family carbohydrate kinase, partial [Victivallaceae bacterium]|nr:PfkB family carbohydrate kinase [Victivallaceae bacterium]
MKRILVAGPNPAWQKVLFFDGFKYGAINRANRLMQFASGKGINFCRAAGCLGRVETQLVQFCGDENGERIDAALGREGISFRSIPTTGATRCCTTCLDRSNGVMTEVIEPTYPASPAEIEAFLSAFSGGLKFASCAAFCGTLPNGTDPALYDRAAKLAVKAGLPVLLDGFRGVDGVLAAGGRVWLKINADELAELTGVKSPADALFKLFSSPGAPEFAAITDGSRPAWASDGDRL